MIMETNVYSKSITAWGAEHPETVVLSADLGTSCEIMEFKKNYPDRYFSLGIAEQNMIGWAAGLAREGFLPYLHSFGVFLYSACPTCASTPSPTRRISRASCPWLMKPAARST